MDVLNQLNLAMAYIEAHIDDDIELADIASVTTYSPYHFGRLFYYIADMSLAEIPKTTWAVFRSEKSKEIGKAIPILFNRAYSEWLPNSGYEKVNGPDMEMYYDSADGTYFEEVWIPVVHV